MITIVIFADPRDIAARVLLPNFLQHINENPKMECAAIFLSAEGSGFRIGLRYWRDKLARKIQLKLGSGSSERALKLPLLSIPKLEKKYSVPVILMPEGDPNHPDILQKLEQDIRADFAFNIYCKKLFREPLLRRFETIVNYHNGSLPHFRGTSASNWSIYQGTKTSGYTFHHMDKGFDTGNILFSGDVTIVPSETPADLELRKARVACYQLPQVLNCVLRRDTGQLQDGIGCEHTRPAYRLVTRVGNPSALSKEEWERRLAAFLLVNTMLSGRWLTVTKIKPCAGPGKLAFCSADGYWLRITCINFWPAWLSVATRRNE